MLKEFRLQTEKTVNALNVEEEKLNSELNEVKDQIKRYKERGAQLKRKVQLHDSIPKDDQDLLLEALSLRVTDVYRTIVDTQFNTLDTLEKMTSIERRMFRLFDQLDKIPEEVLAEMRKKHYIEMMMRLHAEEFRLKLEKLKEREEKLNASQFLRERQTITDYQNDNSLIPSCNERTSTDIFPLDGEHIEAALAVRDHRRHQTPLHQNRQKICFIARLLFRECF
uniref:Uncharacterized protein n=1 Tax=Labrus bergylta TaxID=56723 RepID=A0A3Q3LDG2_9LABR